MALAVLTGLAGARAQVPLKLPVEGGVVQGVTADAIESWKGIPYAAPPVGALRWRPPQKPAAWQGVRNASQLAHDCAQQPFPPDAAPSRTTPSEDCLYLNVWRPASGGKLPVMVWIHGGGFVNGGSSPAVYDASAIAREGVVVVSLNYRLGRFGFFGFPALTAEHPNELKGNYALMDQIAALQWVKRNIARFGGDPAQVTIFGESAGGASVHYLLTTPYAKGLFVRAIVESGGGRKTLLGGRLLQQSSPAGASAEQMGADFAKSVGIAGTNAESLAKLRALPADQITHGLNMASMMSDGYFPGVITDGKLVREDWDTLYNAGKFNQVPVLLGANSADLGFTDAKTKDELFKPFGVLERRARHVYDPTGNADFATVAAQVAGDHYMIEPATHVANEISDKVPVYLYRFGYVAQSQQPHAPHGAAHASEIPYVFGTLQETSYGAQVVPADEAVSDRVRALWVNFAKTGVPSAPGVPAWNAFDPPSRNLLLIGADGSFAAGPDPWQARMDIAAALAP